MKNNTVETGTLNNFNQSYPFCEHIICQVVFIYLAKVRRYLKSKILKDLAALQYEFSNGSCRILFFFIVL